MKKLFSEIPCIRGERVTVRKLELSDADGLRELCESDEVYRFLPAILFEQKYEDKKEVIRKLYDECLEESLILGVFVGGEFCGLAELYGYRAETGEVSVGIRLLKRYRGKGVASETLTVMLDWLLKETDIKKVSASTMPENKASAKSLESFGFECVARGVKADWGYDSLTLSDKWMYSLK